MTWIGAFRGGGDGGSSDLRAPRREASEAGQCRVHCSSRCASEGPWPGMTKVALIVTVYQEWSHGDALGTKVRFYSR